MMFAVCLALASASSYAPPEGWAAGFGDGARIPLVADIDGDGHADLVSVQPVGDASIDVSVTVDGVKAGIPATALDHWGKNCQAAAVVALPGGKAGIAGLFDGRTLRLASAYAGGRFADTPDWVRLPEALKAPGLAALDGGKRLLAFSTKDGAAYRIDPDAKTAAPWRVPGGMVWIGDAGTKLVGQTGNGDLFWIDPDTGARGATLGAEPKSWRPAAAAGLVAFGDRLWTSAGEQALPSDGLPPDPVRYAFGPVAGPGEDLLAFRNGPEGHTGDEIVLRHAAAPGQDPVQIDSSNDGIPDAWKLNGFRGLDFKAMGCKPGQSDVVCLISRFSEVDEKKFHAQIDRVIKFYADLKVKNPDGQTGIHFHPIFLPPIAGDDEKHGWPENRDKFRPAKWRGVVHWMQVTPGGGGQADQLGDGGTVGEGALWMVFVHEFGHQLGLDHQGFWPNGSCPIYSSLMNYNYSYGYEDDGNKIHYSDGSLDGIVLRENDLDEVLPFPYAKVKFLSMGPYRYHLKPDGPDKTFIDWNWNGVFGEHHVKANINYAYGISAGNRTNWGKTMTAPWVFTAGGKAYLLYGAHDFPADPKTDPTVSVDKPGRLLLRRSDKPETWSDPWTIEGGGLIGDPVATEVRGRIACVYQTLNGVVLRWLSPAAHQLSMTAPELLDADRTLQPSVASYGGKLYVFFWNPATKAVTYRVWTGTAASAPFTLDATSDGPVSLCTDTIDGAAVLGLSQDQKDKPARWQIRRYRAAASGALSADGGPQWVEGEAGNARGTGRAIVLFQSGKDAGPAGRIYYFCLGGVSKAAPWQCVYGAMQIADKTVNGGWLVKRYYDEWTQSRSAPGVCWYDGDILYAFRWTDGGQGAGDNGLTVSWHGLGIDAAPFGDHDDLSFIRNWGLNFSLCWLTAG